MKKLTCPWCKSEFVIPNYSRKILCSKSCLGAHKSETQLIRRRKEKLARVEAERIAKAARLARAAQGPIPI